jgi:hypothetical protein
MKEKLMPTLLHECSNCDCSSRQIMAAGGCPKRNRQASNCPPCTGDCNEGRTCPARFLPAGRPLVPGEDATPHAGKDFGPLRGFLIAVIVVFTAWSAVITYGLLMGA